MMCFWKHWLFSFKCLQRHFRLKSILLVCSQFHARLPDPSNLGLNILVSLGRKARHGWNDISLIPQATETGAVQDWAPFAQCCLWHEVAHTATCILKPGACTQILRAAKQQCEVQERHREVRSGFWSHPISLVSTMHHLHAKGSQWLFQSAGPFYALPLKMCEEPHPTDSQQQRPLTPGSRLCCCRGPLPGPTMLAIWQPVVWTWPGHLCSLASICFI